MLKGAYWEMASNPGEVPRAFSVCFGKVNRRKKENERKKEKGRGKKERFIDSSVLSLSLAINFT